MTSKTRDKRPMSDAVPRRFRAPGRINIIGEHTDYNDGFVLPVNTSLYTTVVATPRDDGIIRVITRTLDEVGDFRLGTYRCDGSPQWLTYIIGVAAELDAAGAPLTGADLDIDSNIPIGGGLSSSASLELAVAHALTALAGVVVDCKALAEASRRAEIEFAGVNCGIMDQYSVACGEPGKAMLLDCRSLQAKSVELPLGLSLIVIDSGVAHQLPESGYNDRADECAAAVRSLRRSGADVNSLRDASLDDLEAHRKSLGDLLYRRARHVVNENARTLDAYAALGECDIDQLGALVDGSHASLRDDYEVSCDGIEALVELTSRSEGVKGSRMVGGGFGGCVLTIVESSATGMVVERIRTDYGKLIGREPWIHVVAPADAAGEIRN